jgi:hypothetical protein
MSAQCGQDRQKAALRNDQRPPPLLVIIGGAMVVTDSLSAHPCFKTLDPESCRILDRRCTWLKAAAGARIVDRTPTTATFIL